MSDRDDTAYVQGFLDRAEPIPAGSYWCPDGVTVPGGYLANAEAAGRQCGKSGYPLTAGRVTIEFRSGSRRQLPRTRLGRLLRRKPRWVDARSLVDLSAATLADGVNGGGHDIGLGRNGCGVWIDFSTDMARSLRDAPGVTNVA